MSTVIIWTSVLAYLAAGLAYARATIRRWAADPQSLTRQDRKDDRAEAAIGALGMGLIWPVSMAFCRVRDWLWKPADGARERREQMVRDRDHWRTEASMASTEEARAAAKTIADTLTDLLESS